MRQIEFSYAVKSNKIMQMCESSVKNTFFLMAEQIIVTKSARSCGIFLFVWCVSFGKFHHWSLFQRSKPEYSYFILCMYPLVKTDTFLKKTVRFWLPYLTICVCACEGAIKFHFRAINQGPCFHINDPFACKYAPKRAACITRRWKSGDTTPERAAHASKAALYYICIFTREPTLSARPPHSLASRDNYLSAECISSECCTCIREKHSMLYVYSLRLS